MVGILVGDCRCATSWCDPDLNFDLAVVTLIYKILSGLYLRNSKVYEVDTWLGHSLEVSIAWCSLDLTYDLVLVTMSLKILSWLFIGFGKV